MYPVYPYLDNLYLGNLNPNENLHPSNPEFHKFQKQACEQEDQIESKLNLLDKDLYHVTYARQRIRDGDSGVLCHGLSYYHKPFAGGAWVLQT